MTGCAPDILLWVVQRDCNGKCCIFIVVNQCVTTAFILGINHVIVAVLQAVRIIKQLLCDVLHLFGEPGVKRGYELDLDITGFVQFQLGG